MTEKEIGVYVLRIDRFVGRVKEQILSDSVAFDATYMHSKEPVYFADKDQGEYTPIEEGATWGDTWDSAWFHLKQSVPAAWAGKRVVAHLDFNGEGLVFTPDGQVLQGITNTSVFDHLYGRDVVPLFDSANGCEEVELWVEAAANSLFGVGRDPDPAEESPRRYGHYEGKVNTMKLAVMDYKIWQLWLDLATLQSVMKAVSDKSVRYARILRCLSKVIDVFADDPANASKCRELLKAELNQPANASAPTVHAVGHAHIDTGWLWPVRESIRKSARTYSSQIRLIEKYPGYVFGASQPQHYAFIKEHYPALYEKIRKAVKDGSWECQGGMWVEADCNIISGESMARQLMHGKNFYMDEFGVDVRNLWIPDVFGYSASMPQILKQTGVDYFLTQKICWSQYNKFPYTTFKWRGIDGSEVITHFPPENTYNSGLTAEGQSRAAENFQEKGFIPGFTCLFGVGDGGGGPREEEVEKGLRLANLEGIPKVKFDHAQNYLDTLDDYANELDTWVGELYLETHRGTLTTQARTKRGNRLLEVRLRQTEYLCALASLASYPREQLDRIWKILLINQFHDIIPGSSITMVYDQTEREHRECLAECDDLIATAAGELFEADADSLVLVNVLNSEYTRPIELPESWQGAASDDCACSVQVEDGKTVAMTTLPPQSIITLKKAGAQNAASAKDPMVLENDLIRYEFNDDASIKRIFDKEAGVEVLADGEAGNVITIYEDLPNNWDAWDIDIVYEGMTLGTVKSVACERVADGPVRQGLRFKLEVSKSTLEQTAYLATNSKRIDFVTEADWHEKHRMLRTAFPVSVMNDKATFDIQYGYAERPTHRNTTWDMAKFEVAAQRYVDLSRADYGVALLNDCKYGHKILDNVIDLNLLRSPTHPDPDADRGRHTFTYSLLPHTGDLRNSSVLTEAAQLNVPPILLDGFKAGSVAAPVRVEGDGVSLEVLKKAEKDECRVIRLVETRGVHSDCTLHVADSGATLVETNIIEWQDGDTLACTKPVELTLKPFEIRTFKLKA